MSKTKIFCLAIASVLSASAASPIKAVQSKAPGWGIGFISSKERGQTGGVQLDYKATTYEFGFIGSALLNSREDSSNIVTTWNAMRFGNYMGYRKALRSQLSASSGLEWAVTLSDDWNNYEGFGITTVPYSVGWYASMSYEPLSYVSIFARTNIWDYRENGYKKSSGLNGNATGVFEKIAIGLSYYWQS